MPWYTLDSHSQTAERLTPPQVAVGALIECKLVLLSATLEEREESAGGDSKPVPTRI